MAKREVVMCDKPGCDCAAAGQCALCDQDVCERAHAVQATLGYQTADHAHPQIPLPFLICRECGSNTRNGTKEVLVHGEISQETRYGPESWPPDLAEKLKPLFEAMRAAMASRALRKGQPDDGTAAGLAAATVGQMGTGNTRHAVAEGYVVLRANDGNEYTLPYDNAIQDAIESGSVDIIAWGPNTGPLQGCLKCACSKFQHGDTTPYCATPGCGHGPGHHNRKHAP